MSDASKTFTLYHGDAKILHLIARRKNGDPVDLTGATEILITVDGLQGAVPVVKKLSLTQVVIDVAADGKHSIPYSAVDSPTLFVGDGQDVEGVYTLPSEGPVTVVYSKILNVRKRKGEA